MAQLIDRTIPDLSGAHGLDLVEVALPGDVLATLDRVVVPHRASGLHRGLDVGDRVVLHDLDGDYHQATVVGLDFTLDDTVYAVRLGGRVPPWLAMQRVTGLRQPADEPEQELVDLLAELRLGAVARPSAAQ